MTESFLTTDHILNYLKLGKPVAVSYDNLPVHWRYNRISTMDALFGVLFDKDEEQLSRVFWMETEKRMQEWCSEHLIYFVASPDKRFYTFFTAEMQ